MRCAVDANPDEPIEGRSARTRAAPLPPPRLLRLATHTSSATLQPVEAAATDEAHGAPRWNGRPPGRPSTEGAR
eukprot:5594465-Alexandrium_andersonii.AAC.1